MLLNEVERAERLALPRSESLRKDMAQVAANRINPFIADGEVDAERVVEFLTQYNEFLNHPFKPARPFIERTMKL